MQGVKKVGGTKSTKAKETIVMGEVKALQLFHRMMQLAYLGVSALPILPSQTVCGVERGSVMLYASSLRRPDQGGQLIRGGPTHVAKDISLERSRSKR